jgi:hypothetical protein
MDSGSRERLFLEPGSKIGSFPFWSKSTFTASLSVQTTSCPMLAYPKPMTAVRIVRPLFFVIF